MNNYLSLNLVNGRLGRVVGGGRPTFIMNEQNSVQMYVLDYPKPSTYPANALSDAYAFEVLPRDYNASSVTLSAGVRGGASILSTNSFSNLPTNLVLSSNSNITALEVNAGVYNVTYELNFSVLPTPILGSLFTLSVSMGGFSQTSVKFSFENSTSEINKIITETIQNLSFQYVGLLPGGSSTGAITGNLFQTSDYSFSYFGTQLIIASYIIPAFNSTLNNSGGSAYFGKYGDLDFTSSSWSSIIGTKKEVPIWMEARIGNETIAQGNAILCRKMT